MQMQFVTLQLAKWANDLNDIIHAICFSFIDMDNFVGRSNDAHSYRLSLNRLRGDTFFDAPFWIHLLKKNCN